MYHPLSFSSTPREELKVRNTNGEPVPFVDLGVYTRNRMFRTYLSCKFGKKAILEPSSRNQYPCDGFTRAGVEEFFEGTLVVPEFLESPTLVLPSKCVMPKVRNRSAPTSRSSVGNEATRSTVLDGEGTTSPFPDIERMILRHISSYSPTSNPPAVRTWRVQKDSQGRCTFLVLNIRENRFCHHINREHRSNNVYYCVNLDKSFYQQRCYDPECRSFASVKWAFHN